jgi:tyrosyl-tRNA synthetase
MGKTLGGAVWLNADMKSPYEYWQFWRNTEDADVERFLKLFTDMPMQQIAELAALKGSAINDAKIALADAATEMLHGKDAAIESKAAAMKVFSEGATADGMPSFDVEAIHLEQGYSVLEAFVASGLAKSKSEMKRHIKAGAAKLNGQSINSDDERITSSDLDEENSARLSIGKKRHARLISV